MSKRKQENVSDQENISDIVAEMRDTCHNPTLGIKTDREKRLEKFLKDIIIEYADRIEAAEKRELEAGADKEAEIARLKAALVAAKDELDLARSNSRAMYHRLNSENIRNTEMDRETIHGLREENARLRAALKPVLDIEMDMYTSNLSMEIAINEAKRIYNEGEK